MIDWREIASQELDKGVEIVPGHSVTYRDLAASQLRLFVFAGIQHPDEKLREECIQIVKDAAKCSEIL